MLHLSSFFLILVFSVKILLYNHNNININYADELFYIEIFIIYFRCMCSQRKNSTYIHNKIINYKHFNYFLILY